VIADGPRADHPTDRSRCQEARDVLKAVDWPCNVETNFSDINLGCGRRMSSGIAWAFERSPEVIFLEDDCLPARGFFRFCSTLLEKYREDDRVGMISGDCFLPADLVCSDSYYFSRYAHIWGWAAWRRTWKLYDYDLSTLALAEQRGFFEDQFATPEIGRYFYEKCLDVREGRLDTWDFQVTYSFLSNSLLSIMPARNLISNIGFGPGATHTMAADAPLANLPTFEPDELLRHPPFVVAWRAADRNTEDNVYCIARPPKAEAAEQPAERNSGASWFGLGRWRFKK
jgi:hypothetical protein